MPTPVIPRHTVYAICHRTSNKPVFSGFVNSEISRPIKLGEVARHFGRAGVGPAEDQRFAEQERLPGVEQPQQLCCERAAQHSGLCFTLRLT